MINILNKPLSILSMSVNFLTIRNLPVNLYTFYLYDLTVFVNLVYLYLPTEYKLNNK